VIYLDHQLQECGTPSAPRRRKWKQTTNKDYLIDFGVGRKGCRLTMWLCSPPLDSPPWRHRMCTTDHRTDYDSRLQENTTSLGYPIGKDWTKKCIFKKGMIFGKILLDTKKNYQGWRKLTCVVASLDVLSVMVADGVQVVHVVVSSARLPPWPLPRRPADAIGNRSPFWTACHVRRHVKAEQRELHHRAKLWWRPTLWRLKAKI